MPQCKKCNTNFPRRLKIENKVRNLQSRKYCFICSPFGKHNTSKLEEENSVQIQILEKNTITTVLKCCCRICSRNYIFNPKDNSKGHERNRCNSCIINCRRKFIKEKAVKYKGGKCENCQYSKSIRALCFHHKNPLEKEFNISSAGCYSWLKIKKELDKCTLLCNNCHAEKHDEEELVKQNLKNLEPFVPKLKRK